VNRLGNVELKICHAPGHTPDSICLLVTDHARAPTMVRAHRRHALRRLRRTPRPRRCLGGRDLWETLRRVLLPLPDGVEVYPPTAPAARAGAR